MKTTEEFLSALHDLDIRLWVEDGRLRYRAPTGRLTPALRDELKVRKSEIMRVMEDAQTAFSIEPLPEQAHYDLSHAQQRLWVLAQMEEGSVAYNIPLYLSLEGPLDREAFEKSLAHLIHRHESLRTTFVTVNGAPRQQIHESIDCSIRFDDLTGQAQPEVMAQQQIQAEALKPFDLERGPLLRVALLRLSENRHLMLLTLHHIICDGWSIGVIMREFTEFYEAFHDGTGVSVPPLRIQYRDYAHWQNRQMAGDSLGPHRDYWHEKLSGDLPVMDLPTDFVRPAIQTFNGNELTFTVETMPKSSLVAFCRDRQVSLFMTVVAATKVLLYRYTGQTDVIIASPIAGRNLMELEDQIGFYLNTLVLRDQIDGEAPFETVLQQVRQTATAAYDHQVYPFDRLVNELDLPRDLSRSPLFDVMLILQNASGDLERTAGDLQIRPVMPDAQASKLDMTLHFNETTDRLNFSIEYNTDIFSESRIRRMGNHLTVLMGSILADPRQPVDRLNILTDAEQRQLFHEFNATEMAYPHEETVVDRFEAQAEQMPGTVAVTFEDQELTYKDLNTRADQLAHHLRDLGVRANVLVGICVERSLDMLVGLLGILKAGGAYVPLDPAYPQDRLAYMLEDSQAPVLLTQKGLESGGWKLEVDEKVRVVHLDTDWERISDAHPLPLAPLPRTAPENLAYTIYTSGSTGKPKGVQIGHRALLNFLVSMGQEPGLTADDVLLAVTTLSFDIAALELYLPLIVGAKIVLASREMASDGPQLLECVDQTGITVMQATPATWRLMVAAGWERHPQLRILCGGEALPQDLAALLLEKGREAWNLYGPTETTIWSTVCQVQPAADTGEMVSIGHPIGNTQIYILDQHLQPVPIGVAGELHIGGDGLAKGYLNRPGLTAEKFIREEIRRFGVMSLYKTGDLARWLLDGTVEYLGRMDHQVKLRGFRIELGEIEAVLATHPTVRQSVVVIREDDPADKRLVAYVVHPPDHTPPSTLGEMRNFLKEKLPDYMIPEAFVTMETLPLTPNGKVNRRALPAPDQRRPELESAYTPPRNEVEEQLVSLWQAVLNLERVGIHDNFFELGGHSLRATKLVFDMQRDMAANVKLLDIFRHPTVAELAKITQERGESPYAGIRPLEEPEKAGDAPMTDEELALLEE